MLQMKETPLIRCAHNGHYNMVKYLVEQGADVNAIDLVREQSLHMTPYHSVVKVMHGHSMCTAHDASACGNTIGKQQRHSMHNMSICQSQQERAARMHVALRQAHGCAVSLYTSVSLWQQSQKRHCMHKVSISQKELLGCM